VTARADTENGYRKVTAVLTEQQHRWAEEGRAERAMEGLNLLRVDRHPAGAGGAARAPSVSKETGSGVARAHMAGEVPEAEHVSLPPPQRPAAVRSRAVGKTPAKPETAPPTPVRVLCGRAGHAAGRIAQLPGRRARGHRGGDLQDPEDAPASVRKDQPDVALVDLSIPDRDSRVRFGACRRPVSELKVVVLATPRDRDRILAAVDAGAVGCLLRESGPKNSQRDPGSRPGRVASFSQRDTRSLGKPAEKPPLTTRERQILALVARAWPTSRLPAAWESARRP